MRRKYHRRLKRRKHSNASISGIFLAILTLMAIVASAESIKLPNLHLDIGYYLLVALIALLLFSISWRTIMRVFRFIKKEQKRTHDKKRFEGFKTVAQVQNMNPFEFEKFVAYILEKSEGLTRIKVTNPSNDGGIDIEAYDKDKKILIQVKRYKRGNNVGRPALQQLVGAYHHQASEGWCITTSDYTMGGRMYADTQPSLRLIDGGEFGQIMEKIFEGELDTHFFKGT
ncbi:restriction endonuclease [Candidatus Parcubacteria bacterium]|uniref:Restriction endonuclease type IV Mrr domain-containing protein n=1 Tax=Candidatus Kaiserbacteria bacterium CG10_big_fil_rev_8_21_14_0_10_47_16 TaxID=1974608 RepID=A0A2H0UDC0_9BACT|nr:restriction endonuclease [Candidatus Parcubacteria bacterium]PIR84350.1 MAG: hypothetical protein COU16_02030 [Candidatus Kaiserbacteria bacterium CG10_big_fil_rev_8_21_14_0_10_47_16]